jgi:hypothetical protein
MVAEVIEKLAVLADSLLQPGALSLRQGGHVLAAPRTLRLAHSKIVMAIRACDFAFAPFRPLVTETPVSVSY